MKPNYRQILDDLFAAAGYPSDWCGDIEGVLKHYFEKFEKDLFNEFLNKFKIRRSTCPCGECNDVFFDSNDEKIPRKVQKVHLNIPTGNKDIHVYNSSMLDALWEGAKNPVVKGDDQCPVCANQTEICSYCAKNFEG